MDVFWSTLDAAPRAMSELTGAEITGARFFATLLYVYPLMLIERIFLTGAHHNIQHIYHTLTSAFLMYYNFGSSSGLYLGNVLIVYALLVLLGSSKYAVILSFIINMLYLSIRDWKVISHSDTEQYIITWDIPHCILTLKLIGITWDVYDGAQKANADKEDTLTKVPSLLELLGFAYYPAALMVGPQISFIKYRRFTEGLYNHQRSTSWAPALQRLTIGIILTISYPFLRSYIPTSFFLTQQFKDSWLIMKIFTVGIWGQFVLLRYLGVWLVAEGACIVSGIAYNGKDENGNVLWDGCANMKLLVFFSATRTQHFIDGFHMTTNNWLLKYVYKRLKFMGNKTISQGAALFFLALWHGTESGYFMFFYLEFIGLNAESLICTLFERKAIFRTFITNPTIATIRPFVTKPISTFTLGYALISLDQLQYRSYHEIYKNINYYSIHILYTLVVPPLYMVLNMVLPNHKSLAEKKTD